MGEFDRTDTTAVRTNSLTDSSVTQQFKTHMQAAIELAENSSMYLFALNEDECRQAQDFFLRLATIAQDGLKLAGQRVEALQEYSEPEWISVYQASEILRVSADEILTLAKLGRLESHMKSGAFRVGKDSVLEFRGETGLLEFSELSEVSESEFEEELEFVDALLADQDISAELFEDCGTGNHEVVPLGNDPLSCRTIDVEDAMVLDERDVMECLPVFDPSHQEFVDMIEEMISEGVEDAVFGDEPPTRKVHALLSEQMPPLPVKKK